ncbi:MAG: ABC transporter substrate-binding protein [Saprospiraceae bacterium]
MKKYVVLFSMGFILFSCGRFQNKDEKKDQSVRMVCIAKQYNEIIYALGAEQDLAAVDISSTYPPEIKKLPTVGYHRALSVEGILAAKPTLILHDNNIGPEPVIKQLNDLKIPMMVFKTNGTTIDSTKILIREMGDYFNKKERADQLCNKLDSDMVVAIDQSHQFKDSLKVLVIHFGQASNVFLVMTRNSVAAKMIQWAGGKMAVDDQRGMKQLSAEVVAASDPDVILLTDFGYDRLGTNEKIKELPGVAGTAAAKNNRIYRVEEHDMVYLGPRTGEIVLALQKLIHQGASK